MNNQNHKSSSPSFAAFLCAACFIVGFIMIFYIEPGIHLNPHQRLAFILSNGRFFQAWYLVIFVAFGTSLLVLVNGINKIIARYQTLTYYLSMMFGFIWACYTIACGCIAIFSIEYLLSLPSEQQTSIWFALYSIQMGLGDGVEWVGGLWLLTLSLHGIKHNLPTQSLHRFGVFVGLLGCLTLIPALSTIGAAFGIASIIWFVWAGALFYRARHSLNTLGTPLPRTS